MTSQTQEPTSDTFVEMVRFHNWANLGLLDFCAAHADEIGHDVIVGTYSEVRDMWTHIAVGEAGYLAPFGETLHRELTFEPQLGKFPGFATLRGVLERSGPALLRLARETPGNQIISGTTWDNEPFALPASVFLCQAIAHAADHRSQIKVALTQAGLEPPEFDLWHFVEADEDSTVSHP